jgi:hypothetical protein
MSLTRQQVESWAQTAVDGGRETKAWVNDPANVASPFYTTIAQVDAGVDQGILILRKVAATMEKTELLARRGGLDAKIAELDAIINAP